MRLDHISYAVRSTDDVIKQLQFIYPKILAYKVHESNQNVFISYLGQEGVEHKLELVEAAGVGSPIDGVLKGQPICLYHLGYRVEDFDQALEKMKNQGYFMVTRPFLTSLEHQVWVSHLFHPQGGVIEIVGKKR